MPFDPDRAKAFLRSLSPAEIEEASGREYAEHERQVAKFKTAYAEGRCYLRGEPFDQMRATHPCTHWLLRRCRFKKNDLLKIVERYDYHNIAAFLRWCANEEALLRNINDLESEKSARKIISYTVKWKNIEWTFECTESDKRGHGTGPSSHPHYHFQIRIDGRQFINFDDFHLPFSDRDLFNLTLQNEPKVQEAKRTNKSFSYVAKQRLQGRARIQTVISPAESVPDIASRTEHKPR